MCVLQFLVSVNMYACCVWVWVCVEIMHCTIFSIKQMSFLFSLSPYFWHLKYSRGVWKRFFTLYHGVWKLVHVFEKAVCNGSCKAQRHEIAWYVAPFFAVFGIFSSLIVFVESTIENEARNLLNLIWIDFQAKTDDRNPIANLNNFSYSVQFLIIRKTIELG